MLRIEQSLKKTWKVKKGLLSQSATQYGLEIRVYFAISSLCALEEKQERMLKKKYGYFTKLLDY